MTGPSNLGQGIKLCGLKFEGNARGLAKEIDTLKSKQQGVVQLVGVGAFPAFVVLVWALGSVGSPRAGAECQLDLSHLTMHVALRGWGLGVGSGKEQQPFNCQALHFACQTTVSFLQAKTMSMPCSISEILPGIKPAHPASERNVASAMLKHSASNILGWMMSINIGGCLCVCSVAAVLIDCSPFLRDSEQNPNLE